MFKKIINACLKKVGFKVIKIQAPQKPHIGKASYAFLSQYMEQLSEEPLNPHLHFELAKSAWQRNYYVLANAELRTAKFLGLNNSVAKKLESQLESNSMDISGLSHNSYYRLQSLATAIRKMSGDKPTCILDVGGGEGGLAHFLPGYGYCLAEPTVNGISGEQLPFADMAFDYVVACHVLEHVPPELRQDFLRQLLVKARKGIILLNPFNIEGSSERERLELIIEITGANWAREHIDCSLPDLGIVKSFAERNSLELSVKSNGSLGASMSLVLMEYYASLSGQIRSLEKTNQFFNSHFMGLMDSDAFPAAYLVTLKKTSVV